MAPVVCYICGRDFGSRSITIHIPQCKKKWEYEQARLPKSQRRPIPDEPKNLDKIIKGEVSAEDIRQYNDQAFEDFNTKALEACPNCGRTFLPRALEVHSRSCKPQQQQQQQPRSPSPSKLPQPTSRIRSRKPSTNGRRQQQQPQQQQQQQQRPGTYNVTERKSSTSPPPRRKEEGSGESSPPSVSKAPTKSELARMIQRESALDDPAARTRLARFIRDLSISPSQTPAEA